MRTQAPARTHASTCQLHDSGCDWLDPLNNQSKSCPFNVLKLARCCNMHPPAQSLHMPGEGVQLLVATHKQTHKLKRRRLEGAASVSRRDRKKEPSLQSVCRRMATQTGERQIRLGQSVSRSTLRLQNKTPPTEKWPMKVSVIFSSTPVAPVEH